MKNKVAIAVSTALMSMSMSAAASQLSDGSLYKAIAVSETALTENKQQGVAYHQTTKFVEEQNLAHDIYTYIVRLKDQPLATYDGSIEGLAATSPRIAKKALLESLATSNKSSKEIRDELRLDMKSKASVDYMNFLADKHQSFMNKAAAAVGNQLDVVYQYRKAFNGMAVRLTPTEAKQLSQLSDVAFIERERMETIDTDTGPTHIGAPNVWSGEGQAAVNMGEGVVIGVLDTGINSDHPSFADIGGDGYDHTNPRGAGNYLGDCAGDFASLCNDKLIGIRSYSSITDIYDDTAVFGATPPAKNGEDYNGHGSHTASTAGGNILKDVSLFAPEAGKEESDGIKNNDITFDRVSGVAPHANIVAYQICRPGDSGDTYTACPGAAIIAALNDAVTDDLDVINYSISGGGNPWNSAVELTYLAAQQAGVFVATSAGNSGPRPATTPKNAPWYSAVGASTHSRVINSQLTLGEEKFAFVQGTGPQLEAGKVLTGAIKPAIVAQPANFEGCSAFPANSFENSIALISRGACAFATKVNNATSAGATAVVVYNNRDKTDIFSMGGLAGTTVPAVMVSQDDGAKMLTALGSNSALTVSIDPKLTIATGQADNMAGFSSRGPNNTVPDIMTPSVTAPGVAIYAAYSDQQFGHNNSGAAPSDFDFLQGTSMSSPHVAGAGAVLKSAHPMWTPDNIRSALMLTAVQDVRKEDGTTAADPFDMGAGSIRVDRANKTGLIMDETFANYMKANPAVAGEPSTLNIPSMTDSQCVDTCTWTRTFKATSDASWTVKANAPENVTLTVSPQSFDIKAGATQSITVTADVSKVADSGWNFGDVVLSATDKPNARLPVLVKKSDSNLPTGLDININRAEGSITYTGLKAKDIVNPTATVYEQKLLQEFVGQVRNRRITRYRVTLNNDSARAVFQTSSEKAPDVDLRVRDASGTELGRSESATSNETVILSNLKAGDYLIDLVGFATSHPTDPDNVNVKISTVETSSDFVSKSVTATIKNADNSFDLGLGWKGASNSTGLIELKSGAGASGSAVIPWSITLGEADVKVKVTDDLTNSLKTMTPGVAQSVAFEVLPNFTNEDKVYTFTAELSANHEAVNINNGGKLEGKTVTWNITRKVGESTTPLSVGFDMMPRQAGSDFTLKLTNTLGSNTATNEYTFGVVQGAPKANVNVNPNIREGDQATFDGTVSTDPNNDELTYSWKQIGGQTVSFQATAGKISFNAPSINSESEVISFELTVTDTAGNSNSIISSSNIVQANRSSGGSFGWLLLLGLPLLALRRKLR